MHVEKQTVSNEKRLPLQTAVIEPHIINQPEVKGHFALMHTTDKEIFMHPNGTTGGKKKLFHVSQRPNDSSFLKNYCLERDSSISRNRALEKRKRSLPNYYNTVRDFPKLDFRDY